MLYSNNIVYDPMLTLLFTSVGVKGISNSEIISAEPEPMANLFLFLAKKNALVWKSEE